MTPNAKPSEHLAVLTTFDPVSQGAGTVVTAWVPMKNFFAMVAIVGVGVMTATGTVDAKLRQATDNAGTGAKDITGKAITQLLAAGGNNRQAIINVKAADLDTEGGFGFVALSITVATASSLINPTLLGAF